MQRMVKVETAKTFLMMSWIENSLSILLVLLRQDQTPLWCTFVKPYLFTYSLNQNSYEVTLWVLILLSLSPPLHH